MAEVARDFGIADSCLRRWLKIARAEEAPKAGGDGDLAVENRELRRKVRQLEEEREILRRAAAYFARDTAPK